MTAVYVLDLGDGTHKVGFSSNPRQRCWQVGRGLRLVHSREQSSIKDARRVEKIAHRLLELAGKKVSGEIFSASLDEVVAVIERAERMAAGLEKAPDFVSTRPFNMRVDAAFLAAVKELQRLDDDVPTQSEAIRRAVLHELDRKRREKRK